MIPIPVNIPWRLIIVLSVAAVITWGSFWFRGILADRAELKAENGAQAAEITNLSGEVERMNKVQAADHALFEQVEQQRAIHAAEISSQAANIRKLRDKLNAANQECYSHILPDDYLDRLP